ncbi:sll0742 [Synechocystis sp. PCC 6803]|uniref:Sll0742 protein n=1 Tax=Synechocystis sp. (strain ATCC 27184 / PCC 6803 / Kazusa) TaxID=1111708 RepID=Q55991_SYNY3|nr:MULTISPECIES: DUF29 domain-containing protein [unclassified Synechocystis]BAL33725.1 hypothetical protein SYNPCCN_2808 [Synechocystis sp. PCC 6803 substr. PCC-N]BAL36894.1 hypothetical protein SYNPCCP_2808 [Synechocystis sp. PCC 6803 substr. PCC-P]BAM53631.1 hypothetical protein BEST7613_4700 [Synechocystis sp. PCC 6803] [Bacillus subtilis BEST7613]AGF53064.1 hypothetical protein MYO_128360 [Synechocystis sp. PCC 6803]ALJ68947.1 hypothetical protein AOY38_14545 [Synechocystis sp. PCC 6803]
MVTQMNTKNLYQQDRCLWAKTMADLLKERRLDQLDCQNLIKEIEDMGRSQKKSLKRNLEILLMHLLKWKYQPHKQSNSWRLSIDEHRERILKQLKESPSLKRHFDLVLDEAYGRARKEASIETSIDISRFPALNPFLKEEILDQEFLPK